MPKDSHIEKGTLYYDKEDNETKLKLHLSNGSDIVLTGDSIYKPNKEVNTNMMHVLGTYTIVKKYFVGNDYNLLILCSDWNPNSLKGEVDEIEKYLKLILERIKENNGSLFKVITDMIHESPIKYAYIPGIKCYMYATYHGNNFNLLKETIEKYGYKLKEKRELTEEEKATFGIYYREEDNNEDEK